MVVENPSGEGGLPGQESFEFWREVIGRSRAADMTSDHVETFTGQVRQHQLGPVTVLRMSVPSLRVRRTGRMVRRVDDESYHLTLLTRGRGVAQGALPRPESALAEGSFHLMSSSVPYDNLFFDPSDSGRQQPRVEALGVDIPMSLLPVSPDRLRAVIGRVLPGREGSGALLAQFLIGLDRQGAALRPVEAPGLGMAVVDLLSAWLARELECEQALTPETCHRELVESVRAFVRRNLHDPTLALPVIAAAHHVSLSHLHRLFTQYSGGETLAAFIRRQRMDKAHRDLADLALRALPVQAIAARCGFPRAPEFSRAFKAAHGLSPREHRAQALPNRPTAS
ncbi:AraC family transcriptional regulator [Kitasatospora phosalacinea]|uniref:helix-turn-helix transcriptional regulator n=1 Tax=Kitasatospora phosalacinea TaxID=2065 RepID=UPI003657E638